MKIFSLSTLAVAAALAFTAFTTASAQQRNANPGANANDPVIARVNGAAIHRSDLARLAQSLPPQQQALPAEQLYQALLPALVESKLMQQAAERAKLQDNPQVKAQIDAARGRILADAYGLSVLQGKITEERLRQIYNERLQAFKPEEEVRARHILLADETEAYRVIERLARGEDFMAVLSQTSREPTKAQTQGELGYFTRGQVMGGEANANLIFALNKGDFTRTPLKSDLGWHVIRVEDKRMSQAASFEQARNALAQELSGVLLREAVQALASQAKIEQFDLNGQPIAR